MIADDLALCTGRPEPLEYFGKRFRIARDNERRLIPITIQEDAPPRGIAIYAHVVIAHDLIAKFGLRNGGGCCRSRCPGRRLRIGREKRFQIARHPRFPREHAGEGLAIRIDGEYEEWALAITCMRHTRHTAGGVHVA